MSIPKHSSSLNRPEYLWRTMWFSIVGTSRALCKRTVVKIIFSFPEPGRFQRLYTRECPLADRNRSDTRKRAKNTIVEATTSRRYLERNCNRSVAIVVTRSACLSRALCTTRSCKSWRRLIKRARNGKEEKNFESSVTRPKNMFFTRDFFNLYVNCNLTVYGT